jgi:prepilin-type N-terminal cleavage/methylation domain-containing protein/prepilin-type processing-associated H-X9-DG protein
MLCNLAANRFDRRRRPAFTLVELLVVIAIIGILVALLLPAVQAAREAARRAECTNNLRQIGVACLNYEDSKNTLPPGSGYMHLEAKGTWVLQIMPFMEEQELNELWDFDELGDVNDQDGDGKSNVATAAKVIVNLFICPTDEQSREPILSDRRPGSPGVVTANGNNPPKAQGLWYPGSMGPTIPTSCVFGPPQNMPLPEYRILVGTVCTGSDLGSLNPMTDPMPEKRGCPKEDAVAPLWKRDICNKKNCSGLICRRHLGIALKTVTDGVSNTFLAGETLPGHWTRNCIFCDNYPVSSTHIPINTMEIRPNAVITNPHADYWRTSGFKSMHPGGANMLMGDGSVHFVSETIDWYAWNALGSAFNEDGATSSMYE